MEPLTLYLAGPMRGIAEFNFPAFFEATERLRAAGHTVLSPAERDIEDHGDTIWKGRSGDLAELVGVIEFDLEATMRHDLQWVMDADGIVLLPDWHKSTGARIEALVAKTTGKRIFAYVSESPWDGAPNTLVEVNIDVTAVASEFMSAVRSFGDADA
jgi:hypothetical protein